MRTARVLACLAALAIACAGDPPGPSPTPPAPPPGENDPSYAAAGLRSWYIIGNELTPGHDTLSLTVNAPARTQVIDAWVAGGPGVRLASAGGAFHLDHALAALEPGEHEILLSADGAKTAFARLTFTRSHPIYVVVTTDWDTADNPDQSLSLQEQLHELHPEVKITHFVGPYTFTDPSLAEPRRQYLIDWVKGMRDTWGDEIGVHIHPYCNFVDTTGVSCRAEPSFVYSEGDDTGYTVVLESYSAEELTQMFAATDALFIESGFGKPTSFRAGGWTAGLATFQAMAANGYVADTSALNWRRIEEWEGFRDSTLYEWNKQHWSAIDDTSQPYYPTEDDVLGGDGPEIPVLQVPDNGALVDYVTGEEMIEIFTANWPGGALPEPRQFSIGYHPPNFGTVYQRRMRMALNHVDQFLASNDAGPAIYANLSDLALVWPPSSAAARF